MGNRILGVEERILMNRQVALLAFTVYPDHEQWGLLVQETSSWNMAVVGGKLLSTVVLGCSRNMRHRYSKHSVVMGL